MKKEIFKFIESESPFPISAKRLLDALYGLHADGDAPITDATKIEILEKKLGGSYGFDACGGELNDSLRRFFLEEEYLASEGAISPQTV